MINGSVYNGKWELVIVIVKREKTVLQIAEVYTGDRPLQRTPDWRDVLPHQARKRGSSHLRHDPRRQNNRANPRQQAALRRPQVHSFIFHSFIFYSFYYSFIVSFF